MEASSAAAEFGQKNLLQSKAEEEGAYPGAAPRSRGTVRWVKPGEAAQVSASAWLSQEQRPKSY